MKISYNWLKEILPLTYTPDEVSVMLTDCGLEVESVEEIETIKGGLKGLVIGKVLSVQKHPDADKLSLTTVDVGEFTPLNIVCGAPNVAAEQRVLVAKIGAVLYPSTGDSFEIKKSKIRGAASEGMLCAEDEVGMGASHDGIMVLDENAIAGTPAAEYFKVESDFVFEIGLTPNRIDAASHIGVARDLAAVINAKNNDNKCKLNIPQIDIDAYEKAENNIDIKVEVEDKNACVRYSGIAISNVVVTDSPAWLKNKLLAIGLRPINNIVDITNYVMQEYAQPLHAFDVANISNNNIVVRMASENEKIITLDDAERTLVNTDLVIASDKNAMCIAGVFGGKNSGVSNTTTSVFIESACFNATSVRKTSKRLNLKTDSSFRYERGTDPNNTIYALSRAAQLICEIAGGKIASEIIDIYPTVVERKIVAFSFDRCEELIGKELEHNIVKNILTSLDIEILEKGTDALKLAIPTAKVDVTREADVIEEVLRIYGYNNIELPTTLNSSINYAPKPDKENIQETVANLLSNNGFNEMMSLSLTKSEYANNSIFNEKQSVQILNPLSTEQNVLRQTLLFSGLEAITYNQNRKRNNLKLYEFGKTYKYDDSKEALKRYTEKNTLAMFVCGTKTDDSWAQKNTASTFYSLKSYIEIILNKCGVKFTTQAIENTTLGDGISYRINGKEVATTQVLSKNILKKAGIKGDVFYGVFDWDYLISTQSKVKVEFTEMPKFPEVKRDLALILDKQTNYIDLENTALKTEKKLLKNVNLFDVYEGKNIPENKKSYALSFTLRDDAATLNDKQIEGVMSKLLQAFEKDFGAVLR